MTSAHLRFQSKLLLNQRPLSCPKAGRCQSYLRDKRLRRKIMRAVAPMPARENMLGSGPGVIMTRSWPNAFQPVRLTGNPGGAALGLPVGFAKVITLPIEEPDRKSTR